MLPYTSFSEILCTDGFPYFSSRRVPLGRRRSGKRKGVNFVTWLVSQSFFETLMYALCTMYVHHSGLCSTFMVFWLYRSGTVIEFCAYSSSMLSVTGFFRIGCQSRGWDLFTFLACQLQHEHQQRGAKMVLTPGCVLLS